MSIKVKHEGNATAAAFASAAGGKGKRRQADAASMASVMQQAANAGNQQLRGASAPGATPGRSSAPTFHAQLIGAPTPPMPYGSTRSGVVANSQGGIGRGGGMGGRVTPGTQPTQDQLAELQLQKMRRDMEADQVVESADRFGQHSPDAVWDPTNGGRWVRPYSPGEKEAMALYQKFSVTEPFQISAEGRAEDRAIRESDVKLQNVIGEYIAKKRADVATMPVANQNLQTFRDKLMAKVKETLSNKIKGLPIEDENVDLQDDLEPILKGSGQGYGNPVSDVPSVGVGANDSAVWEDKTGRVVSDGNFGF